MACSAIFGPRKRYSCKSSITLRKGVVRPAFREPTGEPRVRALFARWLDWTCTNTHSGGCPFVQFSFELDDQPGALRDRVIEQQRGWIGILAEAARRAVDAGHFRADLDTEQFAYEFQSLMLGFHHAARLLRDHSAMDRVRQAFETLLRDARRQ